MTKLTFPNMEKRQRLLSSLVVVYIIKFSCLICALFTEYWVDADGYHFGVFKYCVDNTSTCQDVTSQLQTIEGKHFDFDISLHGLRLCINVFIIL